MSKRKTPYKPHAFESKGAKFEYNGKTMTDTSANIYESMLLNDAYLDLIARQRQLYVVCKSQWWGKRKPAKDYPDMGYSDDCFYLNQAQVLKYGLYTPKSISTFYKDMKILISHGFITCISPGNLYGKKSIYEFSSKWQTWKTGDDFNT